jgi:hypothetical protein
MIKALKERGPEAPVIEVMRSDIPIVEHRRNLEEALRVMQEKRLPAVGVNDGAGRLVGLITPENIGEMMRSASRIRSRALMTGSTRRHTDCADVPRCSWPWCQRRLAGPAPGTEGTCDSGRSHYLPPRNRRSNGRMRHKRLVRQRVAFDLSFDLPWSNGRTRSSARGRARSGTARSPHMPQRTGDSARSARAESPG